MSSKSRFAGVKNYIVNCFIDIPGTKSDSGAPNVLFPDMCFSAQIHDTRVIFGSKYPKQ